MFDNLSDRLTAAFAGLRSKGRLSDADIDAVAREIRLALLEADVNLSVVKGFIAAVKERAKGAEVSAALNPAQQVIKIVNEELIGVLGGQTRHLRLAKSPPTVILLAGLQGAGKTTLAGKLGVWLKKQGHAPMLVAADLQRPNAVQQLEVVGRQAGVEVFAPEPGSGVGDPVAVARESLEVARRRAFDVVVVDTAGRLALDEDLMRQAEAIRDAVRPDEVLFVVDAMIGQVAVETALAFQEGVGFSGVVLTKLDGDARGGAALSIAEVCGEPVMFASTGEKLTDFDVFHPERMASRILGMGDVLTLIEQAEDAFEADEAEDMAARLAADDFSLDDFLNQMLMIRRMGPIGNLLGMLPGMGAQVKEALAQVDDKDLDRVQAIIRGMTPGERREPKILNASRRVRIADGSGVTVTEVNQLVDRFFEARTMMRQMGGGMGLPGMKKRSKASAKATAKARKKGGGRGSGGSPAGRVKGGTGNDAARSAGKAPVAAPVNPLGLPAGVGGAAGPGSVRLPGLLGDLPPGLGRPPGNGPAPRGR